MTSQQLNEAKRVLIQREKVARRREAELEKDRKYQSQQQVVDLMRDLQSLNKTLSRLGWMDLPGWLQKRDKKEAETTVALQG